MYIPLLLRHGFRYPQSKPTTGRPGAFRGPPELSVDDIGEAVSPPVKPPVRIGRTVACLGAQATGAGMSSESAFTMAAQRLAMPPIERPVLVYCQAGQRGYYTARILDGLGRDDVVNLAGGNAAYARL